MCVNAISAIIKLKIKTKNKRFPFFFQKKNFSFATIIFNRLSVGAITFGILKQCNHMYRDLIKVKYNNRNLMSRNDQKYCNSN